MRHTTTLQRQLLLLLLLMLGSWVYVHAQEDPYPPALIKRLNIQRIDGYLKMNPSTSDSTLITSEYFYPTGKRQRIDIYDSLGIKDSYRYTYLRDTLMESMSFFRRDTANYQVTFFYNAAGKQLKWVRESFISDENYSVCTSTYDKKDRLTEQETVNAKGKTTHHEKYKYYSNGTMKQKKVLLPEYVEETFEYDEKGKHQRTPQSKTFFVVETFENHAGSGQKMTRETMSYKYPKRIVALNSWMLLQPRAVMVTECYYRPDGLPEYEIQYLNDQFFAKKVYSYLR